MFKNFIGVKMNPPKHSCIAAIQPAAQGRYSRYLGLIVIACLLSIQPACMFRKHGGKAATPQAPPVPVRIALLPFSIPAENSDLRWLSLAAPLLEAKTIENAPAFEIVPLSQTYPVAIESLGAGRSITPDIAAYVADRVGAKWAANGELTATKGGVWMRVDFIPAKSSLVAYRYEKEGNIDSMGSYFIEAFSQFIRYLVLQPLPKAEGKALTPSSLRELGESLNREYGWYIAAEPGKSEKIVADLARTNSGFARLLFDPILYPSIALPAAKPKSIDLRPAAAQNLPAPEVQTQPTTVPAAPAVAEPAPPPTPPAAPPPAQTEPAPVRAEPAKPPETEAEQPAPPAAPPVPQMTVRKDRSSQSKSSATLPPLKSGLPGAATRSAESPASKVEESRSAAAGNKPSISGGTGIQIQVYSTQNKETAEEKAASLVKGGYSAKVEAVDLKEKGMWYRIRIQGFKSQDEAKAAGEKLIAEKQIKQYWIVP
jgi:hypothetical protein